MKNSFNKEAILPHQCWFTLKEACELKNVSYKTVCNKTYLQPNRGTPDAYIGTRKQFRRETILEWLDMTDDEILRSEEGARHGNK